jgi:hypothetical protein
MFFDKLWKVDRSLVCQKKDNARYQEFVISIIVLADGQLLISIKYRDTNSESFRCFVAVSQV